MRRAYRAFFVSVAIGGLLTLSCLLGCEPTLQQRNPEEASAYSLAFNTSDLSIAGDRPMLGGTLKSVRSFS